MFSSRVSDSNQTRSDGAADLLLSRHLLDSHKAMFSPIIHHCRHVQLGCRRGLVDVSSDCVRQLHYEPIKLSAFIMSDACLLQYLISGESVICRLEFTV